MFGVSAKFEFVRVQVIRRRLYDYVNPSSRLVEHGDETACC